jgi:Rieske Fe-S protein
MQSNRAADDGEVLGEVPGPTRREFFSRSCRVASVAALGAAVAAVLESCGGGTTGPSAGLGGAIQALPLVQGGESNGAITVTIGAGSPLAAVGGAALVQSSGGSLVLVARTSQNGFTALTSQCTHQACTVADISGQTYVCPCHGSQFSFTGQVLGGPAPLPLRQFNTQFANDVLTITA